MPYCWLELLRALTNQSVCTWYVARSLGSNVKQRLRWAQAKLRAVIPSWTVLTTGVAVPPPRNAGRIGRAVGVSVGTVVGVKVGLRVGLGVLVGLGVGSRPVRPQATPRVRRANNSRKIFVTGGLCLRHDPLETLYPINKALTTTFNGRRGTVTRVFTLAETTEAEKG